MRNYIGLENLVALLKCVHLHPNQNWSKYAFWSLCCTNFYYGKKAKALRLQLSTCFYYLAPFCVKVKGDDGSLLTTPSLIPFTTQKYV